MKKSVGVTVFLLMILSITLVSAYTTYNYIGSTQDVLNNFLDAGAPIIEAVLGDYTTNVGDFKYGEVLFMKFLIFLILFTVVLTALKRIPLFEDLSNKNSGAVTIISLAISIISVRFMTSSELFYGILLPYSIMGIVITTALPIIILFFFIHNSGFRSTGRRIMWIATLVIYLVLWLTRTDLIGAIGNQIYFWLTIVLIINILADKRINVYLRLDEMKKAFRASDDKAKINALAERDRLNGMPDSVKQDKSWTRSWNRNAKELRRLGVQAAES